MSTAPRDGTVVEIKCSYGVAPWYGLFRWTDEQVVTARDGTKMAFKTKDPSWVGVDRPGHGLCSGDDSLQWRPHDGNAEAYVDPTGGAQSDPAYWRAAVARKYGLPADHFEPKRSLWNRLFG